MNKQEIQQEIKETRERLQALEAKLNEPDKWEPKGGDWKVIVFEGDIAQVHNLGNDSDIKNIVRTQTKEEAKDLAAHLKRQAILWQLANDLNKGWKPDLSSNGHGGHEVFYSCRENKWCCDMCGYVSIPYALFKDRETAQKACEILNNQPELMQ